MSRRIPTSSLAPVPSPRTSNDEALRNYLEGLKAAYLPYMRPSAEARQIVDDAMGERSLTAVLYRSRQHGLL